MGYLSSSQLVRRCVDNVRSGSCYYYTVFNFGRPKTPGQWIAHIVGAIVALFLIGWMLWAYVL